MSDFPEPVLREETMSNGFTLPLLGGLKRRQHLNEVLKMKMRHDDVIVATYPKAEIVWLICNDADTTLARKTMQGDRYGWVEKLGSIAGKGLEELNTWARENTRFMKTHLPFQLLPNELQTEAICKLVYVARNAKDNCVSFYHFHRMNKILPEPGPLSEFLDRFYQGNLPFGSWFEHVHKYWQMSQERQGTIYFVLYENMKSNCKAEIMKLAKFLDKDLSETQIDIIANHCAFENMKENKSVNYSHLAKSGLFDEKISKYMRKGQVGDWKNHFTVSQNEGFDNLFRKKTKDWTLEFDFE